MTLRTERESTWRPGPSDAGLFLAAAAVGAFALIRSHQRWLHPIIDAGRDLYIPEHLARGGMLYRDFAYNYPPLAPYLLSAVVQVWGSSLNVYAAIGVVAGVMTGAALYWLCAALAGRMSGALAAILFFATSFTGEPGYNFLFPYSHALSLGILFILIQLAALMHFLRVRRRPGLLVISLIAGVLASWCRMETAAIACVVVVLAVVLEKAPLLYAAAYALAMTLGILWVHFYFTQPGVSPWAQMIPKSLLVGSRNRAFHAAVAGTSDWRDNLLESLLGAFLLVGIAMLIRLAGTRIRGRFRVAALVGLFAFLCFLQPDTFFRGWLLAIPLLIVIALRQREPTIVLLLSVAVLAAARIWLNMHPGGYGFAFIVLVIPLILYSLFVVLPRAGLYKPEEALWWAPVLLAVAASNLYAQDQRYSASRYPVQTSRGRFLDRDPGRAVVLNQFLWHGVDRAQSMVVLPEGLSLNYFTRVDTPLRRYLFLPPETADPAVEREILEEWSRRPPEKVVLVTRSLDEYGPEQFGVDYNREIQAIVQRDYELEHRWEESGFELRLLRRK